MKSRREALKLVLASITATVLPQLVRAQGEWPIRPVKIIVPYPAGGVNDVVMRMLGEHLRPLLGEAVVVENRAGAGGTIGMNVVAKATDGHTLAFAAVSPLTLNPHVMKLQYDPLKDFVPVASVMYSPVFVMATHRFKGATLSDAIAMAKAAPGTVNIASSGYGTLGHVMIEQIRRKAGSDLTHVPYKGGSQLIADAAGGQFDLFVANPFGPVNNLIAEGKLRVLAVTGPRRLPAMRDVPTLAELGYPEANLTSLFGFFAPSSMPAENVRRFNSAVNQILADPEVQEKLHKFDDVVSTGTPQQFAATIAREFAANAKIIREANIKAE
jgi:tripartite-type tricarboxylate transporter receptor subunit TctC